MSTFLRFLGSLAVFAAASIPLSASADQLSTLTQELSKQLLFVSTGGALPQTVDQKMAPLISSAGPEVADWLSGDKLGTFIYGSQAQTVLHGSGVGGFADSSGRQNDLTPCASISRDGLVVILTAGQSNGSNSIDVDSGGQVYQPHNRFYDLNIADGKCYLARGVALGVANVGTPDHPGIGWSYVAALGDDLIDSGIYKNVLVVPISVDGTYIEQWRPSGNNLFQRFTTAVNDLKAIGLAPTFVLWHQGEANAGEFANSDTPDGTRITLTPALETAGQLSYEREFLNIVAALRGMGVTAPVFPAVASVCGDAPDRVIRSAEESLPDPTWGIYPGPDTDSAIGASLRDKSDCHMTYQGGLLHAQLWKDVIQKYLDGSLVAPPTCSISVSPSSYAPGSVSHVTLTWTSTGATASSIDNGVGTVIHVAPSGSGETGAVPKASTNYVDTVTGPGGENTCTFAITVTQPPSIAASNTGDPMAGSAVQLTGTGFTAQGNTVRLNGGSIDTVSSTDGTHLLFVVPVETPPGAYSLSISNANGVNTNTNNSFHTLRVHTPLSPPSIDLSTPTGIAVHGTVIIRGNGFTDWNFVLLSDGRRFGPLAASSPTALPFVLPSEVLPGTYSYVVANSNGSSGTAALSVTFAPVSLTNDVASLLASAFVPFASVLARLENLFR